MLLCPRCQRTGTILSVRKNGEIEEAVIQWKDPDTGAYWRDCPTTETVRNPAYGCGHCGADGQRLFDALAACRSIG